MLKMSGQTKKIAFCCPHHGFLQNPVEYFSTKVGSKVLVDLPIVHCEKCNRYYSPFGNILALFKPKYRGRLILPSKGIAQKNVERVEVRIPYFSKLETTAEKKVESLANKPKGNIKNKNKQAPRTQRTINNTPPRNVPVHISNTYNFTTGVCPICCSVMSKDRANIPVLYENGDFYRYYVEEILYCHKCKKGYVGQKTVEKLLQRIKAATNYHSIVKLENARVSFSRNQEFLYYPTTENNRVVFIPRYEHHSSTMEYDGEMNLNAQSFLGAMGYTVKLPEYSRRIILAKAVKQYGKRKVTDLICFLISSRQKQFNGATKFANAIRIWQKDLNYITTL